MQLQIGDTINMASREGRCESTTHCVERSIEEVFIGEDPHRISLMSLVSLKQLLGGKTT